MKKIIIFILAGCFFASSCIYSQQWIRYFGQDASATSARIIESYDYGYIFNGNFQKPGKQKQGWIIKTDVNGNKLWDIKIGDGTNYNFTQGIDLTINNGLIVCGETAEIDEKLDGFILKLNSCNEVEWCNIYNTPGITDYNNDVKAVPGGGYISITESYNGGPNIWLFRLDENGNTLWQYPYRQDTNYINEQGFEVIVTQDTCFLISGRNDKENIPGQGWYYMHPFWIKVDKDGNELWELTWYEPGFTGGLFGNSIEDSNGDFFGAGSNGYPGLPCFFKFSKDGVPIYHADLMTNVEYGRTNTINFFSDSTLVIGGQYRFDINHRYSAIFKSDLPGNTITHFDIPLDGGSPSGSTRTFNDRIVFAGSVGIATPYPHFEIVLLKITSDLAYDSIYTSPFVYDNMCPRPIVSDTILLDCNIVSIDDQKGKREEECALRVIPNPAYGKVRIELPSCYVRETSTKQYRLKTFVRSWDAATIDIYDLRGTRVASHTLPRGQTYLETDVSSWAPGMYVVVCTIGGEAVVRGKVVVSEQ